MKEQELKRYLADVIIKNIEFTKKDKEGDYVILTDNECAYGFVLDENEIEILKTWI